MECEMFAFSVGMEGSKICHCAPEDEAYILYKIKPLIYNLIALCQTTGCLMI